MNVKQLFLHRIRYNAKFQLRVISLIIDWIIALYLIVPPLLIGGYQYVQLWKQPPTWFVFIILPIVLLVIKLVGSVGNNRFFIEGADQLFILHRDRWYKGIMRYGLVYSFFIRFVIVTVICGIFAPWFYAQLGYNGLQFASLVVGGTVYIWIEKIVNDFIGFKFKGWMFYLIQIPLTLFGILLFIGGGYLITNFPWIASGASLLMLLLIPLVGRWRLAWQGTFYEQIDKELEMKTRLLSLIMMQVDDKKKPTKRRRALLFRKSNRLFRKYTPIKGVAECLIKAFIRDGKQVRLYLQCIIPVCGAMFLIPVFAKWILFGVVFIILNIWMRVWTKNALKADFLQLFSISDRFKSDVMELTSYWLASPGLLLVSGVIGAVTWGWFGLFLTMIGTSGIHYGLNKWY
ncbi:ABC transporter permease [Paenibacillus sp. KN14-4R]|uniref:ABC transporter permease n=1 Tax=Paenibacillus sp. KN14-4R TaxID=3445773 RepID=UPI003F9F255B